MLLLLQFLFREKGILLPCNSVLVADQYWLIDVTFTVAQVYQAIHSSNMLDSFDNTNKFVENIQHEEVKK
jgi:hypothetical protein